jgi:hypothetical protein
VHVIPQGAVFLRSQPGLQDAGIVVARDQEHVGVCASQDIFQGPELGNQEALDKIVLLMRKRLPGARKVRQEIAAE